MERYHPIVEFIYFGLVIGCSMVFLHPVCLLISILCAAAYTVILFGLNRAVKGFAGVSVLMLLTAIINPTFSHQGITELIELPGGNMLTLESVFFGIAAAFMLGATLLWFRIVSEILTSDKIVYLFGGIFPILGLLLSMILGFIPKVRRKYGEINMSRQIPSKSGNGRRRPADTAGKLRHYMENISILVTWMLEDSVEMGKSMKGRGYGLAGRTRFTIYRFTGRDRRMLICILITGAYVIVGRVNGALSWYYYPVTTGSGTEAYPISVYIAYALLCSIPVVMEFGASTGVRFRKMKMKADA